MKEAILAGGCFWCTEAVFNQLKGVVKVVPGYIGGVNPNPTYQQICTGTTGHAEAIKISFDSSVTKFTELLEVFFATHNPTTLNRQQNDIGTQYRSEIFYCDQNQKIEAEAFIEALELSNAFEDPIVTAVSKATEFYEAEDYHHNYYERNPSQAYCNFMIPPKLEKLQDYFKDKLK
jgi:peptide-methionine (S)-S-oxide reductase